MGKLSLGILFGGKSSEYEVSLSSAYALLSNVDREKYDVLTIGITKDGKWYLFEGDIEKIWGDCSKANKVLKWSADTPLEDVLASAWKWQKTLNSRKKPTQKTSWQRTSKKNNRHYR